MQQSLLVVREGTDYLVWIQSRFEYRLAHCRDSSPGLQPLPVGESPRSDGQPLDEAVPPCFVLGHVRRALASVDGFVGTLVQIEEPLLTNGRFPD